MKDLLYRIVFRASEMIGRYTAFEVSDPADRDAAMAVVEKVRRDELKRVTGGSAIQSSAFDGAEVEDRLLAVRDTRSGRIVGCTRSIRADQVAGIAKSRVEYSLDRIPHELLVRSAIATRLVVARDYRKTPAALVLLQFMYETGVRAGYELCLLSCEPGLYRMYLKLGFRPIGPTHASPTGGFRIPMVLVNQDLAHLEAVGSPLSRVLGRIGPTADAPGLAWFRSLVAAGGSIDAGVAFYDASEDEVETPVHEQLTRGLSDEAKSALLENAVSVPCGVGHVVTEKGDGGRQMGFVQEGVLEVLVNGRTVGILGEGELFGEMAWVLDVARTARLVSAVPETRLLLLSQRAPDRIDDAADQVVLWRNLARVLASRLAVMSAGDRRP